MRQGLLKPTAYLLLVLACGAGRLWAFNNKDPFDISADIVDYSETSRLLLAEGHVRVIQGSGTLTSDHLTYDRTRRQLFASGHVILREKGALLAGERMTYDLDQQKGEVVDIKGSNSSWYFQGGKWEKELDYYQGNSTAFTTCDLVDPHYHFRSTRVHVIPDRQFWAWNNLGYVEDVPVFYSPFIFKSLEPRRVVIQFHPGHDSISGNFVKTVTTIRFQDRVYDRLLLDLFANSGTGFGNEFNYNPNSNLMGSVFAYYVQPKPNPDLPGAPSTAQYNVRTYHWQRLSPTVTLQSNVNIRNNLSFNNEYFPQDTNQAVQDITSSLALTHQTTKINQRVVVERMDAPDAGASNPFAATHIQTASYPSYDLTVYNIPLWSPKSPSTSTVRTAGSMASGAVGASTAAVSGAMRSTSTVAALPYTPPSALSPLFFNMTFFGRNTYARADQQDHLGAGTTLNLTQTYSFLKRWSLTPTFSPQFNWQDKVNPNALALKGYQGRLNFNDALRYRVSNALTFDQSHSVTARLIPNTARLDNNSTDNGLETHHLSWSLNYRPSFKILLRTFSGYDLRRLSNESLDAYHSRKWDSWTSELTLDPSRSVEHFFRYQLSHYPERVSLWEASSRFTTRYRTYVQTGMLYNSGLPGKLTWNNTLGIFASPGWRVETGLNAYVPTTGYQGAQNATLIGSQFSVIRDLHCWEAQFIYRNTPPYSREYSILFNLKMGVTAATEIADKDLESRFYPWRADRSTVYP